MYKIAFCFLSLLPVASGLAQENRYFFQLGDFLGSTSYLGINVAEVDASRAKELKLKEERGVEIKRVEPGSPAEKAGLKERDVVLEYNGQRVEGTEGFIRMVRETPVGRTARIEISRDGNTQSVTATIGQRKDGGFSFNIPAIHPFPLSRPSMFQGRCSRRGPPGSAWKPKP